MDTRKSESGNKALAGRARKKRETEAEANAAPTFQTVQQNRSLRAKGKRKRLRRSRDVSMKTRWGPARQQCLVGNPRGNRNWDRKIFEPGPDPPGKEKIALTGNRIGTGKVGAGGNTAPITFSGAPPLAVALVDPVLSAIPERPR